MIQKISIILGGLRGGHAKGSTHTRAVCHASGGGGGGGGGQHHQPRLIMMGEGRGVGGAMEQDVVQRIEGTEL